jgi:hypothetical protein
VLERDLRGKRQARRRWRDEQVQLFIDNMNTNGSVFKGLVYALRNRALAIVVITGYDLIEWIKPW